MAKNNIRSIRFSDELAELIDRQVGNTFTEKFENLITRCVWELPQKEKELEHIQKQIDDKKAELKQLYQSTAEWRQAVQNITPRLWTLERLLKQECEMKDRNTTDSTGEI